MKRVDPEFILIDEFSLIPLDIVDLIFKSSKKKLILAGDLLQLNPISDIKKMSLDLFSEVYESCDLYSGLLVANHLSNNIYSTPEYRNCSKLLLTQNFRSGSHVINILNNILEGKDFEILHYKDESLRDYVQKNNPTFIASQYKYLSTLYKEFTDPTQFSDSLNTKLGQTFYNQDKKFVLTKNISKTVFNGDIVQITSPGVFHRGNEKIQIDPEDGEYPILPTDYISIHKSQGRSYDHIVVVLDQLFEITMLYTAITRARLDVKFVLVNYDLDKFKQHLQKTINAFNLLKKIIYSK
jgi:ATP-dependent exoDNAse (exonuclease V) alpha subunit